MDVLRHTRSYNQPLKVLEPFFQDDGSGKGHPVRTRSDNQDRKDQMSFSLDDGNGKDRLEHIRSDSRNRKELVEQDHLQQSVMQM